MREDDDWKQEGMPDLEHARFEVLDAFYDIRGGGSFAEAGCYAVVHVVGEH